MKAISWAVVLALLVPASGVVLAADFDFFSESQGGDGVVWPPVSEEMVEPVMSAEPVQKMEVAAPMVEPEGEILLGSQAGMSVDSDGEILLEDQGVAPLMVESLAREEPEIESSFQQADRWQPSAPEPESMPMAAAPPPTAPQWGADQVELQSAQLMPSYQMLETSTMIQNRLVIDLYQMGRRLGR